MVVREIDYRIEDMKSCLKAIHRIREHQIESGEPFFTEGRLEDDIQSGLDEIAVCLPDTEEGKTITRMIDVISKDRAMSWRKKYLSIKFIATNLMGISESRFNDQPLTTIPNSPWRILPPETQPVASATDGAPITGESTFTIPAAAS